MKTAQELLTELNTLDEHLTIEAKTASDAGTSLMETVCAFANEPHLGGGYILLGVTPASDSFWPVYEAVRVPNSDQLQQDIDNSTYRTINREIDTLAASKHLRKLCDCGLLVKKGNGPATYYEPTERALENWPPGTSNTVKSPVLDAKKQELEGKSTELSVKSTEFSPKSTELSTELRDRIVGVGRKSDKSALLRLVVDVLTERHLSAGELAMLLGRTQKHVRTEYLQPKGQNPETLLSFPGGALVHFAVSSSEVRMTTRLEGPKTECLPFNKGNDGAKGNPPNPNGYLTAYLWEEVWQRESWLEILGRYLVYERDDRKQLKRCLFPRYHQLDVTRKLQAVIEGRSRAEVSDPAFRRIRQNQFHRMDSPFSGRSARREQQEDFRHGAGGFGPDSDRWTTVGCDLQFRTNNRSRGDDQRRSQQQECGTCGGSVRR